MHRRLSELSVTSLSSTSACRLSLPASVVPDDELKSETLYRCHASAYLLGGIEWWGSGVRLCRVPFLANKSKRLPHLGHA